MTRLLLDAARAARALGMSKTSLNRMQKDGKTPAPPLPIDVRGKRMYVVSDLERFVRECIAERSAK